MSAPCAFDALFFLLPEAQWWFLVALFTSLDTYQSNGYFAISNSCVLKYFNYSEKVVEAHYA